MSMNGAKSLSVIVEAYGNNVAQNTPGWQQHAVDMRARRPYARLKIPERIHRLEHRHVTIAVAVNASCSLFQVISR